MENKKQLNALVNIKVNSIAETFKQLDLQISELMEFAIDDADATILDLVCNCDDLLTMNGFDYSEASKLYFEFLLSRQ